MSTKAQPVKDVDCDNWCRTVSANTIKSTFMWTIENFNERPEERNDSLKSSDFSITGPDGKKTNWYLELFPKGQDQDPDPFTDYVYVNLYNKDDFVVKAICSFTIIDSSKKEQDTLTLGPCTFNGLDDYDFWGDNFVKMNKLRNNSRTLLPDGNLTILCTLEVVGQDKLYSGSKESSNKIQMKDECLKQVINHLENLFAEKNLSDLEITCDEEVFYCHKLILSARSPVFLAMFQADMKENRSKKVNIPDVKKEVFSEMLRFIYTGKVSSEDSLKDQARDILAVANMYKLDLLKKLCEDQLVSNLNASNCVELLVHGDLHQAAHLKMAALDFIAMNLASLIQTDVYKDFHKQHLQGVPQKIIPCFGGP